MTKYFYIDFEFHHSMEPSYQVVSASILVDGTTHNFWLADDRDTELLRQFIKNLVSDRILVAWQAQAELSALLSLAVDISNIMVLDLAAEWKQLRNRCNKFKYGRVFADKKKTKVVVSEPGSTTTGVSLVDVLLHQLNKTGLADNKKDTRDLILSRDRGAELEGVPFSDEERQQILDYNASDVQYLPALHRKFEENFEGLGIDAARWEKYALKRGEFVKSCARMERLGCPLDIDALKNLEQNQQSIVNHTIEEMNAVHEVFVWDKKTQKYSRKTRLLVDMLKELGVADIWARTEKGAYKFDDETLKDNSHIPAIAQLRTVSKTTQQLKWFRPDAIGDFNQKIGSDNRLRSYLNPFGTQTGRNAPPAKTFILAMSSWLRCLIRPEPGMAITGIDFGSQEFAIAASLSGDPNMRAAYLSGDPYLYFAKAAGAVPPEGTKAEYAKEREIFKTVTLGLQFGLGSEKMARQISAKLGENYTRSQAMEVIGLHKGVYAKFWKFMEFVRFKYYYEREPLILPNGWAMFNDNDRELSVQNFPVQGTGAAIMQEAVNLAHTRGLHIIAPMHDAIYIYHAEDDTEAPKMLAQCMQEANRKFIDLDVKLDPKTITHDKIWVDPKGESDFKKFKKYIYTE